MAGLNKEKKTINKTNSARFPAPPFQQQQQPFPGWRENATAPRSWKTAIREAVA